MIDKINKLIEIYKRLLNFNIKNNHSKDRANCYEMFLSDLEELKKLAEKK